MEAKVKQRLESSLHKAVLLSLDKHVHREYVKQDSAVKIGSKASEAISPEVTNIKIFQRDDIQGKLLILGNPGSGKTTTMLDLARELIQEAKRDSNYPIPILLNLSSWTEKNQVIPEWLIEELNLKYGVKKDLGTKWLEGKQLLPLLDGLDEVKPEQQEPCVQAINQWLEGESRPPYLVVCSRLEEYGSAATRLQLNGSICLKELSESQVRNYLIQLGKENMWQICQHNSNLLELMKNPLLLNIAVLSASDSSMEEWQGRYSKDAQLKLFDKHWHQQIFNRDCQQEEYKHSTEYSAVKRTRSRLIYLAQHLQKDSQTEFLIEKMQPSLLETLQQKRLYCLTLVLLCGLIGQLIGGIVLGLFIGFTFVSSRNEERTNIKFLQGGLLGWLIGLLCSFSLGGFILGIIIGLKIKNSKEIKLIEAFDFSLNNEKVEEVMNQTTKGFQWAFSRIMIPIIWIIIPATLLLIISIFIIWLIEPKFLINSMNFIFPGQTIASLLNEIFSKNTLSMILPILIPFLLTNTFCIGVLGLFYGLVHGFQTDIKSRVYPNQGIWESCKIAVFLSSLVIVVLVFIAKMLNFSIELILPIVIDPIADFGFAGIGCIQHLALRLTLWITGCIPWNYANFLNYSTDRLFLQRIGGQYRFIHKLLQEYFAEMSI